MSQSDDAQKLAFLDTETTGTRPGVHELLEIGVVIVEPESPFAIVDSFAIKVKPERIDDAEPEALAINRYNEEEWRDAVHVDEAVREFCKRVKGTTPWGWNVGFDRAFLEVAMNRAGLGVEDCGLYTWYDLKVDFRRWANLVGREAEFAPRFGLARALRAFRIEVEGFHSALPDAIATYQMFVRLEEEFVLMGERLKNQQLPL